MAILAIKGDSIRGKEVIKTLEMLGGKNKRELKGTEFVEYYYIESTNDNIINFSSNVVTNNLQPYTLDEFYKIHPYNIGDRVKTKEGFNFVIEKIVCDENYDGNLMYILYNPIYDYYRCSVNEIVPNQDNTISIDYSNKNIIMDEDTTNKNAINLSEESIKLISFKDCNVDEIELNLGDNYEIITRNDKYFVVNKQKRYPKTYKECCKVVNASPYVTLVYDISDGQTYSYDVDNLQIHENLRKLKICRDAYWKIAGEQMRLDKPWDSVYGCGEWGYWIGYDINENKIYCQDSRILLNHLLVFPTEEMRDAFYDNFKDLIEYCKELL